MAAFDTFTKNMNQPTNLAGTLAASGISGRIGRRRL